MNWLQYLPVILALAKAAPPALGNILKGIDALHPAAPDIAEAIRAFEAAAVSLEAAISKVAP
jgi:hypothetical protein